jgi:hypothetical protein
MYQKAESSPVFNMVATLVCALLIIGVAHLIDPSIIPYPLIGDPFWQDFDWDHASSFLWVIPVWAISIYVLNIVIQTGLGTRKNIGDTPPSKLLVGGFALSVFSSVTEEIMYRWLLILSSMAFIQLVNFITCGLPEWVNVNILLPLVNFITMGHLEHILINPQWFVGAAILGSTASFRNEHSYQGWLGYVDSWFFGLFMCYTVFEVGLLPAILAHFTFNMVLFSLAACEAHLKAQPFD